MELIKVRSEGYARYEELLLRRDQLRKEAGIYHGLYLKEFGDLLVEIFEKQIDCIRKKKQIAGYQTAMNQGKPIDRDQINILLTREMQEYEDQLQKKIKENNAAKQMSEVSTYTLLKIKRIYRRIAKQLHPDINPMTGEMPELKELWNAVQTAYDCNSLEDLEELEVLVNKALEKIGKGVQEIEIPDLDARIEKVNKEIHEIIETDPYRYKDILDHPSAIEEKRQDLEEERKKYSEYEQELDARIDEILKSGVKVICRMN